MENYGFRTNGWNVSAQFSPLEDVTKSIKHMSLQDAHNNSSKQPDLVQLIRREIVDVGVDLDLFLYGLTADYPDGYNAVELHALTSYNDGMNFLCGSNNFPQNIKAAVRELTISSQLGNLTAGVLLEQMKEYLACEFQFNHGAMELWDKATELGVNCANNFLQCLDQASIDHMRGYFVVNSNG